LARRCLLITKPGALVNAVKIPSRYGMAKMILGNLFDDYSSHYLSPKTILLYKSWKQKITMTPGPAFSQ
jgi:hypothetical protein